MQLKTVLFSTRYLRFGFRQQAQPTFYSILLCRTMATARQQPPWQQPHVHPNANIPPLKVYNSLTKTKVPFVPIDPNGRKVTWYVCGPTVYDDAHLGHARNYVTTDIIRRILRDYFKFDVHFVMNITDVDDKIILRGRQQYLFNKFVSSHPTINATVLDVARSAFKAYLTKNLRLLDPELQPSQYQDEVEKKYATVLNGGPLPGNEKPGDDEAKMKMYIKTLSSAAKAITDAGTASQVSSETFYTDVQDVFLPYLDHLEGSTIDAEDHSIFTKLTSKYEQRFLQDLRDLNVLDPDELTRVTEYGPQIAEFVERIVENKFAYVTSDGSVYFDIKAFEEAGFPYARLEPWSKSDGKLVAEGEGALTSKTTEKRSPSDFALWKASKPGEPSWPSRWGKGRPGWHIECSAMASDRLGKMIDIHSGGIDLAFPHHDNELAQSEAYWNTHTHDQWINYFLHMGHLSIQGSKMSKSLKNFTTIREALERKDWTSRSLRIVFLLGYWNGGIEITDDLVQAGSAWEERVNNFFLNLKDLDILKKSSSGTDQSLGEALAHTQQLVREHLCDSFNTPASMTAISDIIAKFNSADRSTVNFEHVEQLAKWVTSMVNIFGLNGDAPPDPSEIGWSGADVPEEAKPYLYPLSALRDSLRTKALSQEGISPADIKKILENNETNPDTVPIASAEPYAKVLSNFRHTVSSSAEKSEENIGKEILGLCDRVRDVDLFDLGVYLEDRENRPALVRPVSKELLQLREEKAAKLKQKQLEKEKREREAREKAEKGRLSHLEMFRTNEYSAWDADGLPIRDAAGDKITKSRAKKLKKDWERQKKLHEAWLATNSA